MAFLNACGGAEDDLPEPELEVSDISLSKREVSLTAGESETLSISFFPSGADNKNVTWSSEPATVATVDATGKITAIRTGMAVITATTQDGGKTATCSVTVKAGNAAVTGVMFETSALTVSEKDQITLLLSFTPLNATNKNVTWSSSNAAIATVDSNGKLTALKTGTANITVVTADGGKTSTCRITVEASDPNNLLSAIHIPDPIFLEYCRKQMKDKNWDENKDGKLYAEEAAKVKSIDVANTVGNAISSLKGIEYFTGLDYLNCSLNNLTSLDVSKCTKLADLNCNGNGRLSSLKLPATSALKNLDCSSCALTSLDVSGCTRLVDFSCSSNELTSLDVSKCTSLITLNVEGNKLTSLNLTTNGVLRGLTCSNNMISSLNVSYCTSLVTLECDNNRFSSLDISKNTLLRRIDCDMNQLKSLDISKNPAIEVLLCNNNELTSITINDNNSKLTRVLNSNNLMSSDALNNIFEALPPSGSDIVIYNNPGTPTCDIRIAENKNWTVVYQ